MGGSTNYYYMINSLENKPNNLEKMQTDFCELFDDSKRPEAIEIFKSISKEYGSDKRSYHTLDHVRNLLEFLEKYRQQISDWHSVRLATWFHDVVYNTEKHDNEAQSAEYAKKFLEQLSVEKNTIDRVVALIQATAKHEEVADDPDSKYFLDGDLSILGADEKSYDEYADKIRQEYNFVPIDDYKKGRTMVLENFLKRDRIYFSNEMGQDSEEQARKNLKREIEKLSL